MGNQPIRANPKKSVFWTLFLSVAFLLFFAGLMLGIYFLNHRYGKDLQVEKNGIVDLSTWNFHSRGMNFLDAGWQFYPGVQLTPSDITPASADEMNEGTPDLSYYSNVKITDDGWNNLGSKAVWNGTSDSEPNLSQTASGTYRLVVLVPLRTHNITVDFPEINQNARIWMNGELVRSLGGNYNESNTFFSSSSDATITLPSAAGGKIEILISCTTHSTIAPGIACAPGIGTDTQTETLSILSKMWFASLLSLLFIIVITGFYVSLTFTHREKYYYFILLVLSSLIYEFFDKSFNPLPGDLNVRMQITLYIIMTILSVLYFTSLFRSYRTPVVANNLPVDNAIILTALGVYLGVLWLNPEYSRHTEMIWAIVILVCVIQLYVLMRVICMTIRSEEQDFFHIVSAIMSACILATTMVHMQPVVFIPLHSAGIMMLIISTVMYFTVRYVNANNKITRFTTELELAVREKTRNIAKVNAELLLANKRLTENEEARKRMMSNVSHDMRTPITAIRGYLELLLREGDNIDTKSRDTYLRNMHTRCMQMEQLIEGLMQLTRLESGDMDERDENLSVSDLLQSLFDLYDNEARDTGKGIRLILPPEDALLTEGDPNHLLRVFENLILNALRYTGDDGVIEIGAERQGEIPDQQIHVWVKDNGCGIPETELPYIFDRFYRASNSSAVREGTGLGLAIVKSIVNRHHGKVWADSREGEGSTFHVSLPVRQPKE